jgi:hypothetical protein
MYYTSQKGQVACTIDDRDCRIIVNIRNGFALVNSEEVSSVVKLRYTKYTINLVAAVGYVTYSIGTESLQKSTSVGGQRTVHSPGEVRPKDKVGQSSLPQRVVHHHQL